MKSKVIFAMALALFFLNQTVFSQAKWYVDAEFQDEIYSDTLHIELSGKDKVLLIGKEFKELGFFAEEAEALKTTFIADLKAAYASGKLSGEEQEVYYFYKNASQRRIKAEAAEYSEKRVDLAQEMLRLDLNLPKYKFVILDLAHQMEWQVYVENPSELAAKLEAVNIKQAIAVGVANKKFRRQSTQLWVKTDSSAYSISHYQHKRQLSFSVGPAIGLSVIGSKMAPNLGIWAMFQNQNKYGNALFKLGLGLTQSMFVDFNEGKITNNLNFNTIEGLIAFNSGWQAKKAKWVGLSGGMISAPIESDLNNASKFSIHTEGYGPFAWSFDMIGTRNNYLIYGLTLKFPF